MFGNPSLQSFMKVNRAVNKCCKIIEICKYETPRFFLRVFHRTFSLYFWTAFLDFCVFVFVSPECPPLYYFAREHWWYCVTVFLRTDWLNVSLLLFQIWYLANWIFRSLFPNTQGAVTRFNSYEFLIKFNKVVNLLIAVTNPLKKSYGIKGSGSSRK